MGRAAIIELEGVNGELFTLSGRGAGDMGVELGTGPAGIYRAPIKTMWDSYVGQDGATYRGRRYLRRDLVFGLHVVAHDGMPWEEVDSRLQLALDVEREWKLWVTTPTSRRWLTCRISQELATKPAKDQHLQEYGQITVTATAGDPFWYERMATDSWKSTRDTTDGSIEWGELPVWNPTDQPIDLFYVPLAYPGAQWILPDFSFGDDTYERAEADAARKIALPPLLAGEHLRVHTDQRTTQVESTLDTQVYLRMNGVRFLYRVPPKTGTEANPILLPVGVKGAPAGLGIQVRSPRPWSNLWGLQ